MLLRGLLIALLVAFSSLSYGQYDKSYVTIGGGYDLLSFKGDLNPNSRLTSLNNFRGGFSFFIEKRFIGLVGISANGLIGKVSQYENSSTTNLYFQSKINQFDLRVNVYLDNKYLLGSETLFTPYLSAGIGFMAFDPYGDLQDENGNTYYYWSDGSIKDQPESDLNKETANDLSRDYTYESQLTDPNTNYSRNALAIPLTVGVNCKLSHNFNMRVATTYTLTNTDFIDNTSLDSKNDKIISTNFSLAYTIGKKDKAKDIPSDVDLNKLFSEDYDRDGMKDIDDNCPKTPMDIKIDKDGCAIDSDGDGFPDYKDSEVNSDPDALIDETGKTLTDEDLLKRFMDRDSTSMEMNVIQKTHKPEDKDHPKSIGNKKNLQQKRTTNSKEAYSKFQFADFNNDGVIHSKEALNALDYFLAGELDITIGLLHEMIDYYFEQ